jgi:cytochrome c oxidase assembly protein subunit 15
MTAEPQPTPRSAILVLGFGATVVTWAVAWSSQLSPGSVPPLVLAGAVTVILLAAGSLGARLAGLGPRGGAGIGATSAVANLLILGSLVGEGGSAAWVPGSIAIAALLGAIGASATAKRDAAEETDWRFGFALVALGAAFLLMILGGVVTTKGAGLAVPDYPNTYGYNMFLYPFSKMHGGVYFEHTHRLLGSLLGLTTIVLAIFVQRTESRAWVRWSGWGVLLAVIVQGLMGGLRVDALLSGSIEPTKTKPVIGLAVAHGVFGQICFALFAAFAAVLSPTWRRVGEPRPGGAVDRVLTRILVGMIIVQLTLGASYRHLGGLMISHVLGAMIVLVLAIATAARPASLHDDRTLQRFGHALNAMVLLQIVLGITALVIKTGAPDPATRVAYQVAMLTAHQTLGAAILGTATASMLFTNRMLSAAPAPATQTA